MPADTGLRLSSTTAACAASQHCPISDSPAYEVNWRFDSFRQKRGMFKMSEWQGLVLCHIINALWYLYNFVARIQVIAFAHRCS